MRIATYNVEWFTALFDAEGQALADDGPSGRAGVTRRDQLEALGIVFTALDADAVMVIEAPGGPGARATETRLERFADGFGLRARRALTGFTNHTRQEIALLYDPDALTACHDPKGQPTGKKGAPGAPRFDGAFRRDLDIDRAPEIITFSKPPLEAAVETAGGAALRLIGVHLKSKAPREGGAPEERIRAAIENRRKQLAQCIWLRHRVEEHLAAGEALIVLGDLNDGPGLDEYEKLFGRSGVEIVMGADRPAAMRLADPHARAALAAHPAAPPATARFHLRDQGRYLNALLDYILVSPALAARRPRWRIWHPFDDPACFETPELHAALLAASDHFPVSLDIAL